MIQLLVAFLVGAAWGRIWAAGRDIDRDVVAFHAQRVVDAHRYTTGPRLDDLDVAVAELRDLLATRGLGNR